MKSLTFKQYRNIDLFLLGLLLVVSEAITTIATNQWFEDQPLAISTTFIFVCILMMRWNGFAAIHACVGGLVFCIASAATTEQYITYIVGNCFVLGAMIWFKLFKKEDVRKKPFLNFAFTLTAYILMQAGRWVISLFFEANIETLVAFLTTDCITLLFGAVIMNTMRSVDGMIEDQKAYLFRLQRAKQDLPLPDIENDDIASHPNNDD